MKRSYIDAVLWALFVVSSAIAFRIGNMDDAPDLIQVWLLAGATNAVLAGSLVWRHGLSLATPIIIAVYVIANRWLLFYIFLSVIF